MMATPRSLLHPDDVPADLVHLAVNQTGGGVPEPLIRHVLAAVIPTVGARALHAATADEHGAMVAQIADEHIRARAADIHGAVRRQIARDLERVCLAGNHRHYIYATYCRNCETLARQLGLPVDAPNEAADGLFPPAEIEAGT